MKRFAPTTLILALLTATVFGGMSPEVEAQESPGSAPYIDTWAVVGTFDNSGGSGFNTDYLGGETSVTPVVGTVSGGKTWEYFDDRLFSRNADDYQDLYSYYKVVKGVDPSEEIAYVHSYVYSPSNQSNLRLNFGSNDGFKIWLNGSSVGSSSATRLAAKDTDSYTISLSAGWNRLMIKLANGQRAWGFYARIADASGNEVPNLVYSVNGGAGPLAVTTRPMTFAGSPDLPPGFVGWRYVALGGNFGGANLNNGQASPFRLQAQGGTPPYSWSVVAGFLPPGLSVSSAGLVTGRPTIPGSYVFTVRATDAASATANRTVTLVVEEPPTAEYEEDRFSSLVHGPNLAGWNPAVDIPEMKEEGYQYVIPQCLNSATPQWRAPGFGGVTDYVTPTYNQTLLSGLKFGCYWSVYESDRTDGASAPALAGYTGNDWRMAALEDLFDEYGEMKILWFDEIGRSIAGGVGGLTVNREWDAMHSYIRTRNPDVVLLMNDGSQSLMSRGDVDLGETEGWLDGYWGHWPSPMAGDKAMPTESWRFPGQLSLVDHEEWIKVVVSLIGSGFVASLDRSPTAVVNPAFCSCDVDAMHTAIADWMTPGGGLPTRHQSLARTNPSQVFPGDWGYSTIDLDRDTIYLHVLDNGVGKTGLPGGGSLTVGPILSDVASVRVLNDNTSRTFTQTGTELEIDTTGLTADPVDTIFEIQLDDPEPVPTVTAHTAVADATAISTAPNTNYDGILEAKYDDRYGYLKFTVSGVNGKTVQSVRLRLREGSGTGSATNFEVRTTTGAWSESSLTWNNRPATGSTVYGRYAGGAIPEGQYIDVPIDPSLINGDGTYEIMLKPLASAGADSDFFAKEIGEAAQLLIGTSTATATFQPTADAWVWQGTPTTNYGNNLNVMHDERYSYLKFAVSGISGKSVKSVRLRLTESNFGAAGDADFEVRKTTSAWTENGVTWNTRPSLGSIDYGGYNSGRLAESQVVEIALNPSLLNAGDGTYEIALVPRAGTSDSNFFAREDAVPPALVVTYEE